MPPQPSSSSGSPQQAIRQRSTDGLSFYFTTQEMSPTKVDYTPHGESVLPRTLGRNRKRGGRSVFRFDGHQTTNIKDLPRALECYKTYSVYYVEGHMWTVNYDATEIEVNSAVPRDEESGQSSDVEHDRDWYDDWTRLTFNRVEGNESYLSYAGRHLDKTHLLKQRRDQVWATQLLPDAYQARPSNFTSNQNYGGLVGDLPLLIALMAMSLPATAVPSWLPRMIVNHPNTLDSWCVPPDQRVRRCIGWTDHRGIVVSVYHDDESVPKRYLQAYELGAFGPILK